MASLRFSETTIVTGTVLAGNFLNVHQIIGYSIVNIVKVKVTPSIVGGTAEVQLYKRDALLSTDLLYSTNPYANVYFDPVNKDVNGNETEALEGFIAPYVDEDGTGELHLKVINNDSVNKTYTIVITWEQAASFVGPDFQVDGNYRWKSLTSFYGILDHANTADRTYSFPDASGTVLLTTSAILESAITDGAILARVASVEEITGL